MERKKILAVKSSRVLKIRQHCEKNKTESYRSNKSWLLMLSTGYSSFGVEFISVRHGFSGSIVKRYENSRVDRKYKVAFFIFLNRNTNASISYSASFYLRTHAVSLSSFIVIK